MKPKVSLVNPGVKQDANCHFPVGLGYIAASCVKSSIDVEVIDPTSMELDFDETVSRILNSGSNIVGIGGLLLQLKYSMNLVKAIKQKSPDIFIVMGGYQIVELEETILSNCPVDLIVRGEAEIIFPELVNNIYGNKDIYNTPGAVYRKGNDTIFNDNVPVLEDIDYIERPQYELFSVRKYIMNHYLGGLDKTTFYLTGSRGCPYKCSFCTNSKRINKLRYRNPEFIRNEIRYLKSNHGVDDLYLLDENITVNKKWLKNVAEIIHGEGLTWTAMSRADLVDDQSLEIMKANGCSRLVLGIESGSDIVLEKMNKKANTQVYRTGIEMIRKHDIEVQANFMIGMPEDTLETLKETERFCIDNDLVYGPNYVTPFPGTVLFDQTWSKLPPPLEYIDQLWELEIRRTPTFNVSRFTDSTLARIRTSMVINTTAHIISNRFTFIPMRVIKLICRSFLLFFDHFYQFPQIARYTDHLANFFRTKFK